MRYFLRINAALNQKSRCVVNVTQVELGNFGIFTTAEANTSKVTECAVLCEEAGEHLFELEFND